MMTVDAIDHFDAHVEEAGRPARRGSMPIRRYLDDCITPEVAKAMCDAFDRACHVLEERGLGNISTQAIAAKISSLAHAGESDPKRLSALALAEILERKEAS